MRNEINTVAMKVAEAKRVKGVLMLNDKKDNGGSYKTPILDVAFHSKAGVRGGETAQRFYSKFPVYRPRGHGAHSVHDDIERVW